MKTDQSKHNICIASIRRKTMKPYDFKWTKFYETNSDFQYTGIQPDLAHNELFICSTVINTENYSILTTQRLISKQDGKENIAVIEGATDKLYGDFKGYKDNLFTFGALEMRDGSTLNYFIETGKASMVMIHGIRTLLS